MRRTLLSFLLLFTSVSIFSQSYFIKWNSTDNKYEIKQINLSTNSVSDIGTSPTMSTYYDINEIYIDKVNNKIIALYQDTDLWVYNITTNTNQIIDLGTDSYKDLVVSDQKAYLLKWNSSTTKYEIKELNLSNYAISNIGTSSTMSSEYDIEEIELDKNNNQIVALYQDYDLWKYSLSSNTDQIIDLGNDYFRDLLVSDQKTYLIKWNDGNLTYEVKEINLSNNTISNLGTSAPMLSYYDINKIVLDKDNNQIVALYQNTDLWKFNLTSNTAQVIDLGNDDLRDLAVTSQGTTTDILEDLTSNKEDEIIKIVDVLGVELKSVEPYKPLIIIYKSGKTRHIYLQE